MIIFQFILIKSIDTNTQLDEEPSAEDMPRLLKDLEELQSLFDQAAVEKHKLNTELQNCIQRLEAATLIVEKYKIFTIRNFLRLNFFRIQANLFSS